MAGLDLENVEFRDQRFLVRTMNSVFSTWANNGPNLWAIDLQTSNLTSGQTTFNAPSSTVDLLEVVLRRNNTDYVLTRFSRQDYMELPNKDQSGRPTNFWVDKQLTNYVVYMWPITDQSADQIRYYRMVQLQDVNGTGSETLNLPYLWSDAIVSALAYRIGMRSLMKPGTTMTESKLAILERQATQSFFDAVRQNSEKVPLSLDIDAGSYWRF